MARKPKALDLSHMLPTEAYYKGWLLTWLPPPEKTDPVVLTTKKWQELYRWDYTPSLGEVFEICKRLEAGYANS